MKRVDEILSNLYQNVLKPNILKYQNPSGGGLSDTKRGIERSQPLRTIRLPQELTTPQDFKDLWNLTKNLPTVHERYFNIVAPILRSLKDLIQDTFSLELAKNPCGADMDHWIAYLKRQEAQSFPVTKIKNSYYARIPHEDLTAFTHFRLAAVKYELLKALLTTCELILIRRNADGGIIYTHPNNKEGDDLLPGELPSKKIFIDRNFVQQQPDSDPLARVPITKQGCKSFFENFRAEMKTVKIEDDITMDVAQSAVLQHMGDESIPAVALKGDTSKPFLAIPLFRGLCETYPNNSTPFLQQSMREGGCRMTPRASYTERFEPTEQLSSQLPLSALKTLQDTAQSELQGTLFTNMACTFTYKEWRSDDDNYRPGKGRSSFFRHESPPVPQEPLNYQLLYAMFDRRSIAVNHFASEKVVPLRRTRRQHGDDDDDDEEDDDDDDDDAPDDDDRRDKKKVPQIVNHSFNIGLKMKKDIKVSKPWIDAFFDNDYYLAVDPHVLLYNVRPEDRYEAKFYINWLQGEKMMLATYALLSSLQSKIEANYNIQKREIKSKVVNFGSAQAFHVLKPHLSPAELTKTQQQFERRRRGLPQRKLSPPSPAKISLE